MCAKLRTVAASSNRDHPTRSLYYCLFAPHRYIFVHSAQPHHVRDESYNQRNATGEVATTSLPFTTNHTDRTFFVWRLNSARPPHPCHSTILLRSEIPSGMCAKLRTVAASKNRDHSIIACSRHIDIFLFFAHIPFVVNHTINATPPERLQQYYRLVLASLSPGAQQTTSWLYTERALSWHIRNRFLPTNLACPISRLRGEWDYTMIQRIHHRQTRSHGTDGG